jgi:hypothetical protein
MEPLSVCAYDRELPAQHHAGTYHWMTVCVEPGSGRYADPADCDLGPTSWIRTQIFSIPALGSLDEFLYDVAHNDVAKTLNPNSGLVQNTRLLLHRRHSTEANMHCRKVAHAPAFCGVAFRHLELPAFGMVSFDRLGKGWIRFYAMLRGHRWRDHCRRSSHEPGHLRPQRII